MNRSTGLDLDHDVRRDDDIGAVFADDFPVKRYLKRHLAIDREARVAEEDDKSISIDPLCETVACSV